MGKESDNLKTAMTFWNTLVEGSEPLGSLPNGSLGRLSKKRSRLVILSEAKNLLRCELGRFFAFGLG